MTKGVLLAQLGTPDAPTPSALRRYLREFLSDRRVVDFPRWLWLPILYGPILTFRPRKSAELYQRIWTDEGSPLLLTTQAQALALQEELGEDFVVDMGMRYGTPSLREAFARLRGANLEEIIVLPLFPQYSHTTTGSILDVVHEGMAALPGPPVRLIRSHPEQEDYVEALAARCRASAREHGAPDRWLLSFHGIPKRYARKGDPYPQECERTAEALAHTMGWGSGDWHMAYQSRFGPEPWLQPYTDAVLEEWARDGVERVHVSCPGFVADCLETIDEIGDVAAEQFQAAGGAELRLVPGVNEHPVWIQAMGAMVREAAAGAGDVLSS